MTREEWVKVKGEPYVPLGVWFSYYRENGGLIEDPVEFETQFDEVVSQHPIFLDKNTGLLMHVTPDTARKRLFDYYDSIFGL
jgi:hypothetical protein